MRFLPKDNTVVFKKANTEIAASLLKRDGTQELNLLRFSFLYVLPARYFRSNVARLHSVLLFFTPVAGLVFWLVGRILEPCFLL